MPEGKDFFISYTGADRTWAEWIAWTLEEAGHTTLIQAWDFNAASNFVLKMQSGTTDTARTVAVLTPDYFKSAFTQPEWAAAFADDPKSEQGKLIAVRVADFKPPGLFKTIVYIDLVGLDETAAKENLTKSVGSIVTGQRLKPDTRPTFPGTASPATSRARPPFPGTLAGGKTFLHNLPFNPNPFFTGRDKMLDDLHAALQKKTAAAITQPQAVHGLGGVGKTQLAIEYAWLHRADYDAALWVTTSSSVELHAKVAALAPLLNLPEAEVTQQEVKVQAVVEWLRSHQRWLLILDNADTKEAQAAVLKLLPPGLHGHVIVTSRLAGWPVGYEDLEVTVLPETAAKRFLLKRAHKGGFNPGNKADVLAVARELGCLPLALEQAGAYIARHHVSFASYLKLLKESRAGIMEFSSPGGTDYQQTVATTWLISEQQLSQTAQAILQLTAFLAPDEVPRAMFVEGSVVIASAVQIQTQEAQFNPINQLSKHDINEALAELADHSLIELETETFVCHRLLQAVVLDRLKPDDRTLRAELTLRLVNDYAPSDPTDVRTWPTWDRLRPHATAILKELWSEPIIEANALMNDLGSLLDAKALMAEAEPLRRQALKIAEQYMKPDHPVIAVRLSNLASLLKGTNRCEEAEPLYRRALSIDEKYFGPDSSESALILNNLALLLQATKRYGEADQLLRRALAIVDRSFGKTHPRFGIALNNLASLLQEANRQAEAEPLLRQALEVAEQCFGPEHPEVATYLNNVAIGLIRLNRMPEAEPLTRRALDIIEQSFGPDHPHVAIALNSLAQLLQATNRLAEAEPLMRRHLLILHKFNQVTGHEHPHWQGAISNYTNLLVVMGLGKQEIEAKLREAVGE